MNIADNILIPLRETTNELKKTLDTLNKEDKRYPYVQAAQDRAIQTLQLLLQIQRIDRGFFPDKQPDEI